MSEPLREGGGPRSGAAGARVARLFEQHGAMVYGLCRVALRDAEAEDAAQQSFLSAHRALLAGVEPRDEAAWLATIARNECRTRLRTRKHDPLPLLEGLLVGRASSHEAAALSEQITELKSALRALPEKQREAVLLRDLYGLKYGEIAAALATSRPAVEALLFRARRELRVRLRPLRDVAAGLTVPTTLGDALEAAIPGFATSGGTAGAVVAGAGLAKLGSPAAIKVAAAALAVGTAGTVGAAEVGRLTPPPVAGGAALTRIVPTESPAAVAPPEVALTPVAETQPREDERARGDEDAARTSRGRGAEDDREEHDGTLARREDVDGDGDDDVAEFEVDEENDHGSGQSADDTPDADDDADDRDADELDDD